MLNMREKNQVRHNVNGLSEISWLNLAPCWGDWFGVAGIAGILEALVWKKHGGLELARASHGPPAKLLGIMTGVLQKAG